MKLRDHPQMEDKWPPGCTGGFYDKGARIQLPRQQLEECIIVEAKLLRNDVDLQFKNDKIQGSFSLTFDDFGFRKNFVRLVNDNKGKTLGQLLDMEIDF